MKITFIGGGNMAIALIGGLKQRGFSTAALQVVDPVEAARSQLAARFGVRCSDHLDAAALHCDVLVLAVKPQQMQAALAPACGRLGEQLVVSIAAGLSLAAIGRWLGGYTRLIRAMPNTPALVGAGITGLFADPSVDRLGREAAEHILGAVGRTLWVDDEAHMDAVTAVSGSGPAYVFYFIEALQQAAIAQGLPAATARALAIATFAGAAQLAVASSEPVDVLRERVTSKGGTTAAALAVFAEAGLAEGIAAGVAAATARGRELCAQLDRA